MLLQADVHQDWLTKPDGKPGWADYFVSRGYHVYLVDLPYRARSAWDPAVDDVLVVSVEHAQKMFTACSQYGKWPQATLHRQWPGTGRMGDPIFDRFYASSVQMIQTQSTAETAAQAALALLLDRIGTPVVFLSHSHSGGVPFLVADVRPQLVKMIVSVEPKGPPFAAVKLLSGMHNAYGLCNAPITYDPPVVDPELDLVKVTKKAPDPNWMPSVLQAESPPPRKLANLTNTPVLVVTGEASYHAQYDWCMVEYLRQAGVVETEHFKLEDRGILGNGHFMFLERNSDEIAAEIDGWIRRKMSGRDSAT